MSEKLKQIWPAYSAFEDAMDALDHEGVLVVENAACCGTCSHHEIRTLGSDALGTPDQQYHGYAFYHLQDSDGVFNGDRILYLSYGRFDDTGEVATVARTVVCAMQQHGIPVIWNGSCDKRIGLVMLGREGPEDALRIAVAIASAITFNHGVGIPPEHRQEIGTALTTWGESLRSLGGLAAPLISPSEELVEV